MEMELEWDDLYSVLGVEGGPEVTQLEVRKAFRTLALVWHPDKQAGKKNFAISAAAVRFNKIQRAYEVLGDEEAKRAYDTVWNLRKIRLENQKNQSSKRQKMMQDLSDRERAAETERGAKLAEERAAKHLQTELTRIREKIRVERAKRNSAPSSGLPESGESAWSQDVPLDPSPARVLEMQRTLKVSWSTGGTGRIGYTWRRLKDIFGEFGVVEDLVVGESKSGKKGSAVVVMSSKEAAMSATDGYVGDLSNLLRVVLMMPLQSASSKPTPIANGELIDRLSHVFGSGYLSNERDVLQKMRQAGERARKIKEMEEPDSKSA